MAFMICQIRASSNQYGPLTFSGLIYQRFGLSITCLTLFLRMDFHSMPLPILYFKVFQKFLNNDSFDSLHPSQQSFSNVEMGLPGLNQC